MSLIMRDGVAYGAAPTSAGYILPGDNNGEIKVVPEGATPYNVKVKGLGDAAYSNTYAGSTSAGGAATNVTITEETPSTATSYYIPFADSTGSQGLKGTTSLACRLKNGTTSAVGHAIISAGNNIASGTDGNLTGSLRLFGENTKWSTIDAPADASDNTHHTLPATDGTLLNTGTTSFTQTLSSGTKIGSIKINDVSTDVFAPTTGVTYDFAIDHSLNLGQITGVLFFYVDIMSTVTESTVGDTHETYIGSISIDEFIAASSTSAGTEYPIDWTKLSYTGQASGLALALSYDSSNNITLKLKDMMGYGQTLTHAFVHLIHNTTISV